MPSTPAGIQRITLREIRAELKTATSAWRNHVKGCHECARAADDPMKFCDHGWKLAKRLTKARHVMRTWKDSRPAGQGALFE